MPLRHVQTEKQHVSHLFTIKKNNEAGGIKKTNKQTKKALF